VIQNSLKTVLKQFCNYFVSAETKRFGRRGLYDHDDDDNNNNNNNNNNTLKT